MEPFPSLAFSGTQQAQSRQRRTRQATEDETIVLRWERRKVAEKRLNQVMLRKALDNLDALKDACDWAKAWKQESEAMNWLADQIIDSEKKFLVQLHDKASDPNTLRLLAFQDAGIVFYQLEHYPSNTNWINIFHDHQAEYVSRWRPMLAKEHEAYCLEQNDQLRAYHEHTRREMEDCRRETAEARQREHEEYPPEVREAMLRKDKHEREGSQQRRLP